MLDPEALAGRVILLACDDVFTGEYVRDCLLGAGAHVVGPARQLTGVEGFTGDGTRPDCVLLSLSLGGDEAGRTVASLRDDGVPVVLMLRHNQRIDEALSDLPRLVAPFGGFQAVEAVQAALSRAAVRFGARPGDRESGAGPLQTEATRSLAT